MAALDNAQATTTLKAILGLGAWATAPTANKIRLGNTSPTAGTAMTELPGGSGYTTGGSTISWSAVSGTPPTSTNSGAITWTNTSTAWSIVGGETWDTAPLRWLFGLWNGQPIAVATNNAFQLAAAGASASLS